MTKKEKQNIVAHFTEEINKNPVIYLANIEGLNANATYELRKTCFKKGVKIKVVKNTLLKLAMENSQKDLKSLYDTLKGNTSVMFSDIANLPAKIIKQFNKKYQKPILKGAYIEEQCFVGEDKLEELINIKSKNELIAEIILLLQSPVKNVISALQSGKNNLAGIIKTLSQKQE